MLEEYDGCDDKDRNEKDNRVLHHIAKEARHGCASLFRNRPNHKIGRISNVGISPKENRTSRNSHQVCGIFGN